MFLCQKPINAIAACLLAAHVLLAPAPAVEPPYEPTDEPQQLDALLARLGLAELRLHHLEQRLNNETDASRRAELSKQLVDRFVEALLAAAEDPSRFALLRAQVETFLAANPAARTPEIDIVLLQAEYQQAESALIAWQEDPRGVAAGRDAARATLARIQPLLARHQETLIAEADKTADSIDALQSEQQRQTAEQQLARQRTLAARADYFAGWSAYYLGVARADSRAAQADSRAAQADYQQAKQHFLRLLDISDEDDYQHVEPDALGLDSVWRARAVIGLGLAELGLARARTGERVLAWLNQAAVAPSIREQVHYWQLRGLLNADLRSPAAELASREVAGLIPPPSAGNNTFCVTAVRGGARLPPGPERRTLVLAGISGLAQLRQFDALDKLISQWGLDDGDLAADFHLTWLRGRRQYLAAEKSRDAAAFQTAAATLTAALDAPAARDHLQAAAQARYYLAWTRYRLGELDAAAQLFAAAAAALRANYADVAAQAQWMRATCLVERSQQDPRQAAAAIAALQAFKQEFPASPEAERVDLVVARLRAAHTSGEDSLQELARVKPDDPTYASAQFEICRIQHQLWSQAKENTGQAKPRAADLLASVHRTLGLGDRMAADLRLKAALLGVDALRRSEPPDWSQIGSLLDQVAGDAQPVPATATSRIEYAYRRLELAQQERRIAEANEHAAWIAAHGAGTPYELPALILLARATDQSLAAAPPSDRPQKLTAARNTYERLVRLLGESPAAYSASKNALAASAKLAHLDEELGNWREAADRLEKLVAAQPADRRLLRRAALAAFHARRYAPSLAHWRTLLGGLDSGTADWLEAKSYQIKCLQHTDPESAEKTRRQFELLYPDQKLP